jgi:hypothetical protein
VQQSDFGQYAVGSIREQVMNEVGLGKKNERSYDKADTHREKPAVALLFENAPQPEQVGQEEEQASYSRCDDKGRIELATQLPKIGKYATHQELPRPPFLIFQVS